MSSEQYFHYLQNEFMAEATPHCRKTYRIAGHTFELSFLTHEASDAFACHFAETDTTNAPDFKVSVWDSITSNKKMIEPRWSGSDCKQKGAIDGYESARFPMVYDVGSQALSIADLETKQAHFWTPNLRSLPYWERGSPLRNILHWLLPLKGKHLVHSAAVGSPDGGVLIVGKGGSGKTTTALSCLKTDLLYCADDYCALTSDPVPTVHNVFATAKVSPSTAQHFGAPAAETNDEKVVLNIAQLYPKKCTESFPIKAILFPKITHDGIPSHSHISKGVILRELAASTILQLPGSNGHMLSILASITKQVPCYILNLSTHYQQNAKQIETLVRSHNDC